MYDNLITLAKALKDLYTSTVSKNPESTITNNTNSFTNKEKSFKLNTLHSSLKHILIYDCKKQNIDIELFLANTLTTLANISENQKKSENTQTKPPYLHIMQILDTKHDNQSDISFQVKDLHAEIFALFNEIFTQTQGKNFSKYFLEWVILMISYKDNFGINATNLKTVITEQLSSSTGTQITKPELNDIIDCQLSRLLDVHAHGVNENGEINQHADKQVYDCLSFIDNILKTYAVQPSNSEQTDTTCGCRI